MYKNIKLYSNIVLEVLVMKKIIGVVLGLLLCCTVFTTGIYATQKKQSNQDKKSTKKHTLLHTNDIHGRMVEEKGSVIGMAKLKTLKDQKRPDLMLDAGDAFQGLPVSNNSKGEEMAKAMNSVGYDAMTLGNHEFDFGFKQLLHLKKQLNFPIISSNVYKNGKHPFKPSTVIKRNGIRYGIVAVTTPETKVKTRPDSIKGLKFADPVNSAEKEAKKLHNKADVIVVLSHLGVDPVTKKSWRGDNLTQELTSKKSIKQPVIVIDGHSHTELDKGEQFGNGIVAQTGTALANVGDITFDYSHDKVSHLAAKLINVKDVSHLKGNKQIAQQVNGANKKFLKETSKVVREHNNVKFEGDKNIARTTETNLGNLITDAMESYGNKEFKHKPDFAVTNGGGIRASIDKGKVTQNNIITVLPFGNTITQISVKGSDVKKAFEHSLSSPTKTENHKKVLTPNGGFLQGSKSIRVTYNLNKAKQHRVTSIKVLDKKSGHFKKLDPDKKYHVATNDFTANKGDGYKMFGGKKEEGISLDEVVAKYFKKANLKEYNTNQPQRIKEHKTKKEQSKSKDKAA